MRANPDALHGHPPADADTAIRQLYSDHAQALHGYVRRFCPDNASADDIVQETATAVLGALLAVTVLATAGRTGPGRQTKNPCAIDRAGHRVRKIHASLTATDTDGTVFRLDEREQLLWVHCAEVDSYVDVLRRCGMGATPGQLDRFVAEQRRSAALVGLDPEQVPASVAELDAYYAEARHRARACAEAKRSLLMSFNPPVPAALVPLKLVAPPVNALAFAALPRWARKLYGSPGGRVTDAVTTAALRGLYQATRAVPARLRYTPTVRHARQLVHDHDQHQHALP